MKDVVKIIDKYGRVIYSGSLLDMPIKASYIIDRSIEIFNDPDPCIIHKSFVIRKIVDEMKEMLNIKDSTGIALRNHRSECWFLDIDDIEETVIHFGIQ